MESGEEARHLTVERAANSIMRAVVSCESLAHCYRMREMLYRFHHVHGDTVQVRGWVDSIALAIKNREQEIVCKL